MSEFPAAAVAQAIGGVASALINQPKTMSPRKQILSTVRGAREAGIHPLAALGSGATYSQVGGNSVLGDAVGSGISAIGRAMETEKSQAELDSLRADTDARRAQADLYKAQSRTLLSRAARNALGGPPLQDTPPNLKIFGGGVTRDPNMFSSAQKVQDEFGDIMENVVGIPSFAWSVGKNVDSWADRAERTLREFLQRNISGGGGIPKWKG